MSFKSLAKMLSAGCLALAAFTALSGCDRKEQLIDIETPQGEVEVERDKDSGAVDVEVSGEGGGTDL